MNAPDEGIRRSGDEGVRVLVEQGANLTNRYLRAGAGSAAGRPDLDEAITVLEEAYHRIEPGEALRGRVAGQLGWLYGVRHLAHGGTTQDRTTGMHLLDESLRFPHQTPVLSAGSKLLLGQLLLAGLIAGLKSPEDAMRQMMTGGGRPADVPDADRAIALFREVADGPQVSAELTASARAMATIGEALRGMLGGPGGMDFSKLGEALAATQAFSQARMQGLAAPPMADLGSFLQVTPKPAAPAAKRPAKTRDFEALIEQSSLGTPAAQRLRRRTPRAQAEAVQRIAQLRDLAAHGTTDQQQRAQQELAEVFRTLGYTDRLAELQRQAASAGHADIGVLTTLEQETRAVLEVLRTRADVQRVRLSSGAVAYQARLDTPDGTPIRIAVLPAQDHGALAATLGYRALVEGFSPDVVLLVGIAGGSSNNLRIGDVVISDEMVFYDAAEVTPEGVSRRSQTQTLPAWLGYRLNAFRAEAGADLIGPDGMPFRTHVGPIGALNTDVADAESEIRTLQRTYHDQVLTVETEAAGFAIAFQEDPRPDGWLVIRGIAEMADVKKLRDDMFHDLAARHAATVMLAFAPYLVRSL